MNKKLTIIIPCYNEAVHIEKVLGRIHELALAYEKEVILVDDGSLDQTYERVMNFMAIHPTFPISVLRHEKNKGKGASIRTALPGISGQLVIIQDADLEYDPRDYSRLIGPIEEGFADVVFGSRFRGSDPHRGPFLFHRWGNRFFTGLINLITSQNFTDIHTCYKMFRTEVLRNLHTREQRFGVDPEMVVKLSKNRKIRVYEVGISYHGRSYAEGKKISWTDAFRALYCIIRYSFFDKGQSTHAGEQN